MVEVSAAVRRRVLALLERSAATPVVKRLAPALPIAVPTALLAWLSLRSVLAKTGGTPAAPLDDAYIHFQFARSFAQGTPLVYSPGAGPVGGATSLLWPGLLAVGYALGFRGHAMVWVAWALGFVALGLLAAEAQRATRGLASRLSAAGAAALVLSFGANTWFAASGMEVIPLSWLMLRGVRRAAEWCEGVDREDAGAQRSRRVELLILALAAPLMRPEGALSSVLIAIALLATPRRGTRAFSLLALAGVALPALINRALTGDFASTTARSKWLLLSPYATRTSLVSAFRSYLETLVGTLLNGEIWSAIFLPRGSAPVLLLSLAALPLAGWLRARNSRGLLLGALALGIIFPGTYDCPMCNRLRYLWPFFPAWLVGAAVLSDLVGAALAVRARELRAIGHLVLGGMAGALVGYLPFAVEDVGNSAAAIFRQQVSLGLWAERAVPKGARIGLNDTGAISYFSGHPTFDVVGLTTAGEARYWAAGPGSRFEHYERLGRARLPSYFIIYPEWFALDDLLGDRLEERYVPGASILGGERMVAYLADYRLLGSGEAPGADARGGRALVDRLDVADLESEREHGYQLFSASQQQSVLGRFGAQLDGGRSERTNDRFQLKVTPGGVLVLRVAADSATTLVVRVGEREQTFEVPASLWHEAALPLPSQLSPGNQPISIRSASGSFTSFHYFSLGQSSATAADR
ncbi:MAG TPA: hypothetical protein VG937_03570 [Polyangiaceae bacterium]|nr:hypothetical protein [Polyangiaceae bacterium]